MANRQLIKRIFHAWFLLSRPMTLGVRILLQDDEGKVLLVRHTYVEGWYLPGGGVESGESQHAAAKKELREETGISCKGELELVGVYLNSLATKRDHVTLFRCEKWEREAPFEPNREISEIGFFELDALPTDTTAATRRRIDEVFGSAPQSETW